MASIIYRIDDKGVRAKLQALKDAGDDMRPVFATVGRVISNKVRVCFKLGIDPWGTKWRALKYRKGEPLRDTGRLNRSISTAVDSQGVTIGTNVKYAPFHQFGTKGRSKDASRFQGVDGRGRFMRTESFTAKKNQAARALGVLKARRLNFRQGGGAIPARPFLPLRPGGQADLPATWRVDVLLALRQHFLGRVRGIV